MMRENEFPVTSFRNEKTILDCHIYRQFNDAIAIELSLDRCRMMLSFKRLIRWLHFLATFNIRKSRSHRLYYGYIGIDIVCFLLDTIVQRNGEKEYNAERKINILYRS